MRIHERQLPERPLPPGVVDMREAVKAATQKPSDDAAKGLRLPAPTRQARPECTAQAVRARYQGAVWLECIVGPDGAVGDVTVLRSLSPDLDQQAVAAAKRWRFTPGERDGVPVPFLVPIAMDFRLQ